MVWLTIIGIQMLLVFVWLRTMRFWRTINKADIFLNKSTLFLRKHEFDKDARHIADDQRPRYDEWKVENFITIVLVFVVFTLLPVIGAASMEGIDSSGLNILIAVLLALIGYLWNLMRIRVDILNIECDYVDSLVNIVKSNETSLEHT